MGILNNNDDDDDDGDGDDDDDDDDNNNNNNNIQPLWTGWITNEPKDELPEWRNKKQFMGLELFFCYSNDTAGVLAGIAPHSL